MRGGGSACFPGGEVCCAHPRAHQRNHPPTIDYYLSNLHSNRALVQICTPCFDPFGNPFANPTSPLRLLARYRFCNVLRLFFSLSLFLSLSLSLSPLQSSRACSIVFSRDGFSARIRLGIFPKKKKKKKKKIKKERTTRYRTD